jgi:hypothetical protein
VTRIRFAPALVLLLACASTPAPPHAAQPLPHAGAADAALSACGARLHAALGQGQPARVLLDGSGLSRVLLPEAESRVLAQRAPLRAPGYVADTKSSLWSGSRFAEICVQQGREEPPNGALGLRAPGFVFERALLVGRELDGGLLAAWVEGVFVYTDAGFYALSLERVEPPRRDHSDLELAVCELRARSASP